RGCYGPLRVLHTKARQSEKCCGSELEDALLAMQALGHAFFFGARNVGRLTGLDFCLILAPEQPTIAENLIIQANEDIESSSLWLIHEIYSPGRRAGHDGIWRNVSGDDRTCPDYRALADGQPAQNGRVRSDRRPSTDSRRFHLPISALLQF